MDALVEKQVEVIEHLHNQGLSPELFAFPDISQKLAKQQSILNDFEANNKKYKEYIEIEQESNRLIKESFRKMEEQYLENQKEINSLNLNLEGIEKEFKQFLVDNGLETKEHFNFTNFNREAVQRLLEAKRNRQSEKLALGYKKDGGGDQAPEGGIQPKGRTAQRAQLQDNGGDAEHPSVRVRALRELLCYPHE